MTQMSSLYMVRNFKEIESMKEKKKKKFQSKGLGLLKITTKMTMKGKKN